MIPKALTMRERGDILVMAHKGWTEKEETVQDCLSRLKHAIKTNLYEIRVIGERQCDYKKGIEHTTQYTLSELYPNKDPAEVLSEELSHLRVEEYIETVPDEHRKNKSPFLVFAKAYDEQYVYIKFRVEHIEHKGFSFVLVMSFHFSEYDINKETFPYRKRRE